MELPINVVVTMFVGLLVGGLIVVFAQNVIFSSQMEFDETFKDKENNSFFDLKQITDSQIALLAKSCYDKSFGHALESQLCFIVHGESPVSLDSAKVKEVSGVEVNVSDDTSKFFLIKWNAKENVVEVTT
jgi:hypothetical protein